MRFYDVSQDYVNYLRKYDHRIPLMEYDDHDKFVCGIILKIGDIEYYSPISHFNIAQRTNFAIKDKGKVISTVRLCFMFPATSDYLTTKDFKAIAKTDKLYADLLQTEYKYCVAHEKDIQKKAETVYRIGCNKNHSFNKCCCDFKLLEQHYKKYCPKTADI